MTEDQIKAYVRHGGMRCPHCESPNLTGGSLEDAGEPGVRGDAECNTCGKKWVEIFTLTGVEPRE